MDKKTKRIRTAKKVARAGTNAAAWTVGSVLSLGVRIIATILLITITSGLLFTCVFAYYVQTSLMEDVDVRLEDFQDTVALTSSIEYYNKDSGKWETLQTLYSTINTVWVAYDNIPQYLEYAAVAIEDKRFYEHKGVDWWRTTGAFSNMFLQMRDTFGGSTITQQLIKNITKEDDATVQRKLLEIFRALDFERMYTKDQIMEWYLNSIFLGERCYGVGTAANTYFGKEVWDLSLAECASIIGITNNPSRYDPFISKSNNKKRQETILFAMYEQGYITRDEYDSAVAENLVFTQGENEEYIEEVRTWYVDNVIRDVIKDLQDKKGYSKNIAEMLVYSGGYTIRSCIDMDIQNIVDAMYQDWSKMPKGWGATQNLQSAIVIIDQYTGDIVAMTGGIGEKTANLLHDRATIAKRPPGSSFKPISVYAPALDLGLITQPTLVNDAAGIVLKGTTWYPKNSGGGNIGVVTIRDAVRMSLNTVAAQTLDVLGPSESYRYLTQKLGVKSLVVPNDIDYAPLSLGQLTNGITVREMAQAYSALANNGIYRDSRMYSVVLDRNGNVVIDNTSEPQIAFQENTAWNMTSMLVNAVNAGTGTEARLYNMTVAGKTGTTTLNRDRYFTGYTPYYVASVWTGYDMPETMNFGASNPAAVIWRNIMSQIHEGLEFKTFPTPVVGGATNIFGGLKIAASPSPSPSADAEDPDASPSVDPEDPDTSQPPTDAPPTDAPPTDAPPTDAPPPSSEVTPEPPPVEVTPNPLPTVELPPPDVPPTEDAEAA